MRYSTASDDAGGWLYTAGANGEALRVNCTHTDSKGERWDRY